MKTEILDKVCDLAIKVGRYQAEQRKTFDRNVVESKHTHDYVSYVDKESERTIVAALRELLPEAGFITEEKTTEQNSGAEYEWIIDPLDGTTNYIHDLEPWCVSIALKHNDELVMGVVYEVTRHELFYATKGNGAWMRNADGETRQLKVSKVGDLDQALVLIGYPYNAEDYRDFCTSLTARLYGHCASIRSMGSAEASLCYVAAGRLDVYLESFLCPWDVSAGAVIVSEAGGRVSDYRASDELWRSGREMLATNGTLHSAMIREIQNIIPHNNC